MAEKKRCEQCEQEKELDQFYRRQNKTDGRMRICAECYLTNLHETQRRQRELQQEWERQRAEEERRKAEESQRIQALLPTLLSGETKRCVDCKQEFSVNERGCLVIPFVPPATCNRCGKPLRIEYHEDWVSYGCQGHMGGASTLWRGFSSTYCPTCHEERRKKNRQAYPLCPMCGTPTCVYDFLREYHGYRLALIKVCCEKCIPRFEALPESEQLEVLRRAIVKAYGETAVIYALQYDDYFPCQHIGRTQHYNRRIAEYKRNWHTEIKHHFILEELPFGPRSMERESRWMLHALKHRWPIDNFELLKTGEDGLGGRRLQAQLTETVRSFEPLTAPFETIAPLLNQLGNPCDAHVVHWLYERLGGSTTLRHFKK